MHCSHHHVRKVTRSKAQQLEKANIMITCDEGSCVCAKNNINSVIYECVECEWMLFAICQPCYDLRRNPTITNEVLGNYTEGDLKSLVTQSMSLNTLRQLRSKADDVLDVTEENRERELRENTVDLT